MTTVPGLAAQQPRTVSCDEALRIARLDAEQVYRDLTPYRIQVVLQADGWHVDYDFNAPGLQGGGPHYVIDAVTGAVLSKHYEQ